MSVRHAQRATSHMLGFLQDQLWHSVAVNNLKRMRKPYVAQDSQQMLKDFISLQVHPSYLIKNKITKEVDPKGKLYQRDLLTTSKFVKKDLKKSVFGSSKSGSRAGMGSRRMKRVVSRMMTQGTDFKKCQLQPFNSTCCPLLISQTAPNQDQLLREEGLRKTKNQKCKIYQREASQLQERRKKQKDSLNTEKRKMSQGKGFTFDYEGKVMPVAGKAKDNLKVIAVKDKVDSSGDLVATRSSKYPKFSPKNTTIHNKRVVFLGTKMEDYDEDTNTKIHKMLKTQPTSTIFDIFKDGNNMEEGISFTDMVQQSTIFGKERCKTLNKNMKLSEFIQNKSAFKPKGMGENLSKHMGLNRTKKKQPSSAVRQKQKQKDNLQVESNAQSKSLCSSLSRLIDKSGVIKKNDLIFSQAFSEVS